MIRRLRSTVLRLPLRIAPDSAYWQDEGQPSSLLEETCREQVGRLHTLHLLDAYLATAAGGRRRQAISDERKSLRTLYEAIWAEIELALSEGIVQRARECVEAQHLAVRSDGRTQLEILL